jgi:DNA-directed RNA polymerase subunit RPC12/RpoP
MPLRIECPNCRKKFPLPLKQAVRGTSVGCPHCAAAVLIDGDLLTELFWAFNHGGAENDPRPPREHRPF